MKVGRVNDDEDGDASRKQEQPTVVVAVCGARVRMAVRIAHDVARQEHRPNPG